jgi:putative copper export protein
MNLSTLLLFGHVLSAMAWLGGGLVLSVLAVRVRDSPDPAAIRDFGGILSYVGPRVLTPGVAGTAGSGIALLLIEDGSQIGRAWVIAAIALFVLAVAIGIGHLARIGLRLGRVADAPAPDDDPRALLGSWIRGYAVVLAILIVIVLDMIAKPGAAS